MTRLAAIGRKGLTVLEIVLPLILVVLAIYMLNPEVSRLLSDAKDSGVKGGLAGLRMAISLSVATISVREISSGNATPFPTHAELNANRYSGDAPGFHTALNGLAILDRVSKAPSNPWTDSATVHDCTGMERGTLLKGEQANDGWCYDPTKGVIWANSALSTGKQKENEF